VVFGLSTDYGIFLLSRVSEGRSRGLSDRDAIEDGLVRTGRLITAGAVIFSVAVGAFVFSDLVIVKQSAVAISVAVLLDASLIRCFLLPAAMRLLGPRAWRWPGTA
jgi:trehalose monomycolate/heme transporter